MKAILLSNIPHYHHLAVALERAGMLERYITANVLLEDEQPSALLPLYWKRKLEGRRLRGISRSKVRSIRFPEMLQRVLPRLHLASSERSNWINNHLFDWQARSYVEECDVFHFVNSVGLYCARKAKRLGAITICDARWLHPRFHSRTIAEEYARLGLPRPETGESYEDKNLEEIALSDYIIVPSESARRSFVQEGVSADRLLVLPYGVEVDHFVPAPQDDSVFRVLFAGTITPGKGIHYLLEAFSRLSLPHSELVIAGTLDPAMKPILAKYEGKFTYLPTLPRLDLVKLYNRSSVFVLPSLSDSFSLATLEAMACGLPVIVSRETGIADLIADGRQGFVVPSRDVESIREKLHFLYETPDIRRAMGSEASIAARRQTWDRYAEEAVGIYKRIRDSRETAPLKSVYAAETRS